MPSSKDYQKQTKAKEQKIQAGIQNAVAGAKVNVIDAKIALQQKAEGAYSIMQKGAKKIKDNIKKTLN